LIIIGALAVRAVKRRRESKFTTPKNLACEGFLQRYGGCFVVAEGVAGKVD